MSPTTKCFELEKLKRVLKEYSSIQCAYYGEACIVLLNELKHRSGISLRVYSDMLSQGQLEEDYKLQWRAKPNTNGWQAVNKLVENGATGIAFFLIREKTEYSIIKESRILKGKHKSGIDYWLSYSKNHPLYDEDNFLQARLEISGIKKGNASKIRRRLKIKTTQAQASAGTGFPVYIVVAEFGTPTATLLER